ncbi:hypothetical protein [Mycoplasma wenyonii]|nr:hypothetical protein [Mycoplasma wenyonii]
MSWFARGAVLLISSYGVSHFPQGVKEVANLVERFKGSLPPPR